MLGEVELEAALEGFVSDDVIELAQNAWGFGVDDGSVGGFCGIEVGDFLVDGGGSLGFVDGVGGGLDGLVEVLPDVAVGTECGEAFVGHVLREAFLEPEVVEPAHGDEVSEPLMGELVEDEDVAVEAIEGGGRGAEEDGLFAEEGAAGVFHAAVGEAGDEDHFIFGEGERLREVGGEVLNALGGGGLDNGDFGFGGLSFGFADPDIGHALCGEDVDEGSGSEGEEVGGNGFGFGEGGGSSAGRCGIAKQLTIYDNGEGVGDDVPVLRRSDGEIKARFEVGLIEAGEGHAGVHGDEEGVEIFLAVVVVFKAGDGFACGADVGGEVNFEGVGARAEGLGRQNEMAVADGRRNRKAVERDGGDCAVAKIEEEGLYDGAGIAEVEPEFFGGVGGGRVGNQVVTEPVVEIGDAGGALLGEGAGDSVGDFGCVGGCRDEGDDGH